MAEKESTAIEQVAILFQMDIDQKTQKEAEKATENMISLISDLAIIGKVAGEALGKMWSGMQKTIEAGLDEFDDINLGLTVGVDPDELGALKYAISQIGGESKDVITMLSQMDKVIQSFRNPATGAKEMEDFFKDLSTFGVSKESMDGIEEAIKNEDLVSAIKLFGETRNQLGDQFSNFMGRRGMSSLGALEIDFQYEDWKEAWNKSSQRVFEVNTKGLNDLENGWADINTAMSGLTKWLGAEMGGNLNELGDSVLQLTNRFLEWVDIFKTDTKAKKFLESTSDLLGVDKAFIEGEKSAGQAMLDGLRKGGQWLVDLRDIAFGSTSKEDLNFDPTNFGAGYNNMGNIDMSLFPKERNSTTVNVDTMNINSDNPEEFGDSLNNELRGYIE